MPANRFAGDICVISMSEQFSTWDIRLMKIVVEKTV
jgi:hypothetical protein